MANASVFITGANRGLGLEFVRQYAADGWRVFAACRQPAAANELQALASASSSIEVLELDVADFAAIDHAAASLSGTPIDVLINNAGVFGPKPKAENDLRQTFGHMDYTIWADLLRVNTMAPLRIAEAFIDHVAASQQRKLLTVSSTMGSFVEGSPGVYAYRTSKAAVNMAMSTLAQDPAAANVIVSLLNPGWVQTDMGGSAAPLAIDASVQSMRGVIDGLSPADSGRFLDYDGREISW